MLLTIGAIGAFMFATADPPDISGDWSGDEWGKVILKQTAAGEYTGTYDVVGKDPGKFEVNWSRIERRYNGKWSEGKDRFGDISIRLVDDEIRGGWTTNRKSKTNPATPALADLLWVRPKTESASSPGSGQREGNDKTSVAVGWTFKAEIKTFVRTTSSPSINSLRLSDGHKFNLPKNRPSEKQDGGDVSREELEKWLSETSVNFAIDYYSQTDHWELKLRNVKFAQLPDEDWKTLTADELQEQFSHLKWTTPGDRDAQQKIFGFYTLIFGRSFPPPFTFAFETSDGQRGIFEINGYAHMGALGDEAYVRYKQLQQKDGSTNEASGGETAASESPRTAQSNRNRKLAFGPVVERTLNDISIGSFNSALNLVTGERLSPDAREFENAKTWAEANGVDLIACGDGGGRGLRIIDGLALRLGSAGPSGMLPPRKWLKPSPVRSADLRS